MVVMGGINIGIVIGIVIAVGNLLIDVNIVYRQAAEHLVGSGLADDGGNLLIGQAQMIGGKILSRESGMGRIQTGIQNRHHHAGTVIGETGAIENTGIKNIDLVLDQLGLGLFIDLADNNALAVLQRLANSIKIPGGDLQLEAAEKSIVVLTGVVGNPLLIQNRENLGLLRGNALTNISGLVTGKGKILEAHGFVGDLVSIQQVDLINGNNNRDLLIVLNGVGKPEHNGVVQIVFQIQLGCIVQLLDEGCFVTSHLCVGGGDNSEKNGRHQQTDKRGFDHDG